MAKKDSKKSSAAPIKGHSHKSSNKSQGSKSDSKSGGKASAKGKEKSGMKISAAKAAVKKPSRPEKSSGKPDFKKGLKKDSIILKKTPSKKEEVKAPKKFDKVVNKELLPKKGPEKNSEKAEASKKPQSKTSVEPVKKGQERSDVSGKDILQVKKKNLGSDKVISEKSEKSEKFEKSSKPLELEDKVSVKSGGSGRKGPKGKKGEESELDDVGFMADDETGDDEIGEYADELKAVEELDTDTEDLDAWAQDSRDKEDQEIVLTDAEGRRYCRSRDCDQIAVVDGYCRFHYLLFWKKIQIRKKILADGKLQRYVEELTARYPDKFLELIRRDLRTEKDFLSAIQELEIDEGAIENDFEEDNSSFIEEVRTMGESGGVGGTGMDEDEY